MCADEIMPAHLNSDLPRKLWSETSVDVELHKLLKLAFACIGPLALLQALLLDLRHLNLALRGH